MNADTTALVEVRSAEERIVSVRLVAWGEQITIRGRPESFARGAFANLNPTDTVALLMHDVTRPIGRMVSLEERSDGAYAEFRIAATQAGDEVLTLAADGILGAVSVGFKPGTQSAQGVHTRIAALPEVSFVTAGFGAYESARVLATREADQEHNMPEAAAAEPAEVPAAEPVDLSPIETRLDTLTNEVREIRTLQAAAPAENVETRMSPVAWFTRELRVAEGLETRAAPDQMDGYLQTGDAEGLVNWSYEPGQLVNILDTRRPFFARTGSFPAPASGHVLTPIVTTGTKVGSRAAQFADANTQAMVVGDKLFSAKWFDGAVDISLELIQTSDPSALALVWDDLVGQYAISTEVGAIEDIEATSGLGSADALPLGGSNTYKAFARAVAAAAMEVRKATGAPATKLALPYALWPDAVSFVDAKDRRQFTAGDYSDGSVTLTAEAFGIAGGIEVFAAGVTNPVMYNESAIRTADYGITKVEATVVQKMSHQVGVLGRTIVVPRIPAGIIVFEDTSSTTTTTTTTTSTATSTSTTTTG